MANPFTPSFGVSPPLLAGRGTLVEAFVESLDEGPGSAGRATLYTGARGAGKTVMLNAVEDEARRRRWLVVSETASPGFVRRIERDHLPRLLAEIDPGAVQRRITGVTGPFATGGVTWSTADAYAPDASVRTLVERVTDVLARQGTGLLITLDEIHRDQIGELREIATTIQHGFREERNLAFVGAVLTSAVTDVTSDNVLTFLRRADRHHLGPVSRDDVRLGIRGPVEASGRRIDSRALDIMTDGTRGYPFLIQLVGAQTWRLHPNVPSISTADAAEGVARALRRLGALVYEPALADASAIDKSFLLAMARDDGPSRMGDIQQRLDVDVNYASQYRLRLIAAELIEPTRHGYVDFALPYLREYLREHAVADIDR